MLSALLATSLVLGAFENTTATREDVALELLARVNATRLVALNPTARPQLLYFSERRGAVLARVVIPAGGSLEYDFPHGTLSGLEFELLARDRNGLRSSGRLPLTALVEGEFDLIWMESVGRSLHTWGELPTGPALVPATRAPGPGLELLVAPAALAPHVPVITPTDKPKGDLPPRIEPEPLPPV